MSIAKINDYGVGGTMSPSEFNKLKNQGKISGTFDSHDKDGDGKIESKERTKEGAIGNSKNNEPEKTSGPDKGAQSSGGKVLNSHEGNSKTYTITKPGTYTIGAGVGNPNTDNGNNKLPEIKADGGNYSVKKGGSNDVGGTKMTIVVTENDIPVKVTVNGNDSAHCKSFIAEGKQQMAVFDDSLKNQNQNGVFFIGSSGSDTVTVGVPKDTESKEGKSNPQHVYL